MELPEPKHIRAENNKIFYFDVGNNERGTFVRISEVCILVAFHFFVSSVRKNLHLAQLISFQLWIREVPAFLKYYVCLTGKCT